MKEKVFIDVMVEFLTNISSAFPENNGCKEGLKWLDILPESTHIRIVENWYEMTTPILDDIKNKNCEVVANAIDTSTNTVLSKINAKEIMACEDQDTIDSIWQYISTLTAICNTIMKNKSKVVPPTSPISPVASSNTVVPTGSISPPPGFPAQPVSSPVVPPPVRVPVPVVPPKTSAVPTKPQPADVVKGITTAIPEIFKSLNEIMKDKSDANPLGQMLHQMMNPGALQPGVAPNLAANMFDSSSNVMQQVSAETGLQTEDIIAKLKKLEMYEKARARKKKTH